MPTGGSRAKTKEEEHSQESLGSSQESLANTEEEIREGRDEGAMKHYHWSKPSKRIVSHSHKDGDKIHIHENKGWFGYGRTKKSLFGGKKPPMR